LAIGSDCGISAIGAGAASAGADAAESSMSLTGALEQPTVPKNANPSEAIKNAFFIKIPPKLFSDRPSTFAAELMFQNLLSEVSSAWVGPGLARR